MTRSSCSVTVFRGRCISVARLEVDRKVNVFKNDRFRNAVLGGIVSLSILSSGLPAAARLESVNRPELLPTEQTTVIDVAGFLTSSEESKLSKVINRVENETGVKVRLLVQNYPETPGLAIRDYWGVDDDTVVLVADPTFGGILNFNVGANVDLRVPRSFWSRLTGKFGNKFYWQEKGESTSIINAIYAIDSCLNETPSRFQCKSIEEVE
eukprot:g4809.t1